MGVHISLLLVKGHVSQSIACGASASVGSRERACVWVGGFDDANVHEDVSERYWDLLGLIKECVLAARSVVCRGSDTWHVLPWHQPCQAEQTEEEKQAWEGEGEDHVVGSSRLGENEQPLFTETERERYDVEVEDIQKENSCSKSVRDNILVFGNLKLFQIFTYFVVQFSHHQLSGCLLWRWRQHHMADTSI